MQVRVLHRLPALLQAGHQVRPRPQLRQDGAARAPSAQLPLLPARQGAGRPAEVVEEEQGGVPDRASGCRCCGAARQLPRTSAEGSPGRDGGRGMRGANTRRAGRLLYSALCGVPLRSHHSEQAGGCQST